MRINRRTDAKGRAGDAKRGRSMLLRISHFTPTVIDIRELGRFTTKIKDILSSAGTWKVLCCARQETRAHLSSRTLNMDWARLLRKWMKERHENGKCVSVERTQRDREKHNYTRKGRAGGREGPEREWNICLRCHWTD